MTAKILCIEDESEIRQIILEELTDAGYETMEADSGKTGLAAIIAGSPDLVLCDMNMPEMDGNELLQTIRGGHPDLADMPFVFLTAQSDRDSMLNGRKLGADDYLTKPIDFELLFVTLEARLGQVQRMEAKQEQQLVKLYRTVSGSSDSAAAPPPAPPAQASVDRGAAPAAPATDPETRNKLAALSSQNNGQVATGRLQFVGLAEIRDELGDRWPAFAEKVFDIAEKTITRRTTESDVFNRDENDGFVICFSQLGEAEALFKANSIAEEIRQKILGSEGIAAGNAKPGSGPGKEGPGEHVDSHAARASQALSADAHSIDLTLQEVQDTAGVFDLVMTRVNQAATLSRQSNEATLREIFDSCLIRMGSVELRNGNDTPFKLALFDERTQLKIDSLLRSNRNANDLLAELDMLRLAQTAEKIYNNPPASKLVAVVRINFATLDYRRHQDRIVALLQSLSEPAPSSIALMISGIPEGIYSSRLVNMTNIIRPYCRLIAVELGGPSLDTVDPLEIRSPLVACSFESLTAVLAKNPEKIRTLIGDIHSKKARFLVHSIPTRECKGSLTKLGVDMLSMA